MKEQQKISSPKSAISLLVMAVALFCSSAAWAQNPKVLIFSKTSKYHHNSIAAGIIAIQKLGVENKFDVDTTTDVSKFTDANLKQYATVIFLSPTSASSLTNDAKNIVFKDSLNKDALKNYIHNGGGFLGIHSATDFGYEWAWYGKMVGGYFLGHPNPRNVQKARLQIVDKKSPATKNLPDTLTRADEYYSFKPGSNPADLHVLIKLDENTMDYGRQTNLKMGDHPISWYHDYDGGRAFYTAMGHTDASFSEPFVLNHILGALQYTMGKKYKGKKQ